MRRRRPRRANALEPRASFARTFSPPCARPRRRCAERAMGKARARRSEQRQPWHLCLRRPEISADFHHFEYVNVDAPKGGLISLLPGTRINNQSYFTFNSLNAFILKGEGAQGMDLTFATLMARAGDEPDAVYGYAAKSVEISPDKLTYIFTMRPEARFHDGSRLTARDVAFSLTTLKTKGHPLIIQQMRDMVKAEAPDDNTVIVTFAPKHGRDVPLFVVVQPIFSQAYYANRNFEESTLDTPLGSGPYKVGKFEVNRYIEFDRVKDWWAADLPINRGSIQFRHHPLRVLSRSRRRLRRLYREKLSVPRGVHLADLGDALRFPGDQGRPGQARAAARRYAVGRAGLVHESAAHAICGPARARSVDLRLRFRMDQQDHHVRRLCAHLVAVPELRPDGERAAVARGGEAARTLQGTGARRGVRRALRAAGLRRIGTGPRAVAQGVATAAGRRTSGEGRQAPAAERRRVQDRISPDESSIEPHHGPYIKNLAVLGIEATYPPDRRRAISRPAGRFRFRHDDGALLAVGHARRQHAAVLLVTSRRHQGLVQPGRHQESGRWTR